MTEPVKKKCGFLARWWHRRLRGIDRDTMLPALQHAAMIQLPLDPAKQHALVDEVWSTFIQSPGQEHWRCQCSVGDPR